MANDIIDAINEMASAETATAKSLAITLLRNAADALNCGIGPYSEIEKNRLYRLSIFARGYFDFLHLQDDFNFRGWEQHPEIIDYLWTLSHDCKDRMDSFPGSVQGELVEEIKERITAFFGYIYIEYGPGIYLSHDVVVNRMTCTICGKNSKICEHEPGGVYDGKMCRQEMSDFDLKSISLVHHPADYRCRVWPWNFNSETGVFSACALVLFQIDDFIYEEDWPASFLRRRKRMEQIKSTEGRTNSNI